MALEFFLLLDEYLSNVLLLSISVVSLSLMIVLSPASDDVLTLDGVLAGIFIFILIRVDLKVIIALPVVDTVVRVYVPVVYVHPLDSSLHHLSLHVSPPALARLIST
jgi:hypothetical protein